MSRFGDISVCAYGPKKWLPCAIHVTICKHTYLYIYIYNISDESCTVPLHTVACLACARLPTVPNLFKITTDLLLVMDSKSYMRFHLEPLSLTLSDLERSIQRSHKFPMAYISKSIQDNQLLFVMDRKS